jgi:hypothetical protein
MEDEGINAEVVTTMPAAGQEPRGLNTWNCLTCRKRKVRCDRRDPCSNCVKLGFKCSFPSSGRVPHRSDDASSKIPSGSRRRQQGLVDRLKHLESVVDNLTAQLSSDETTQVDRRASAMDPDHGFSALPALPAKPSSLAKNVSKVTDTREALLERETDADEAGLLVAKNGESVYVANHFWTFLRQEIGSITKALEQGGQTDEDSDDGLDDDSRGTSETSPWGDEPSPGNGAYDAGFVFPFAGDARFGEALAQLRPLPSQMLFIWQIYVENVDPVLKILHVPSIARQIQESRGQLFCLSPAMEALVFAISLVAVGSLPEEEVRRLLVLIESQWNYSKG